MAALKRWAPGLAVLLLVALWLGIHSFNNYRADRAFVAYRAYLRAHPEEAARKVAAIPFDDSIRVDRLQVLLLSATGEVVPLDSTALAMDLRVGGRHFYFKRIMVGLPYMDSPTVWRGALWCRVPQQEMP